MPKAGLPILPLMAIILGGFMAILDTSIVNIAIPTMMGVFGTSIDQMQWVVTIYMLTMAVVVPLSAWLSRRMGMKRLYMLSMVVFVLGSALSGLSWNISSMIIFRCFQALGAGMIMPVTMTMLYHLVPRERIGTAMGLWGITAMTAPAFGPTLGGYLVQYVDWRFIFYINLPVCIVALLLAEFFIVTDPGHPALPFDLPGFLTSAAGLFTLLFALSEGQKYGWTSELIVICLYLSAVLLAIFIYVELRSPHPLLDLRIFSSFNFTLSNLLLLIAVTGLYGGIFYVPLFLQTVNGLGALQTGLLLMPAGIMAGIAMPISGQIYDRFGARVAVLPGLFILAVATYLLHSLSPSTPDSTINLWLVIRSFGMGLAMMPITTAGLSYLPQSKIASASAMSNIVRMVGASFSLAALTATLQGYQSSFANDLANAYTPGSLPLKVAETALHGTPASPAFLVALFSLIQSQSFVRGVDQIFVVTAIITFVGVFLSLFLHSKKAPRGVPMSTE